MNYLRLGHTMHVEPLPQCCGASFISGFFFTKRTHYGLYQDSFPDLNTFKECLEEAEEEAAYDERTAYLLAILNAHQNMTYAEWMTACGWTTIGEPVKNPNTGNLLYTWTKTVEVPRDEDEDEEDYDYDE